MKSLYKKHQLSRTQFSNRRHLAMIVTKSVTAFSKCRVTATGFAAGLPVNVALKYPFFGEYSLCTVVEPARRHAASFASVSASGGTQ